MLNTVIENLNSYGNTWAVWVGASILDAAMVLVLAAILWLAVRKKAPMQLGYCLFLLVLVKLFVPLEIAVPERVAQWTPVHMLSAAWTRPEGPGSGAPDEGLAYESEPAAGKGGAQGESWSPDATPDPQGHVAQSPADSNELLAPSEMPLEQVAVEGGSGEVNVAVAPVQSAAASGQATGYLSVFGWIMIAWAAGVCILLIRLLRVQVRFHRELRKAKPVDVAGLPVDFRELCNRIGVRRRVRIVESDAIASPAVWGVRRPVLILPEGMAGSLSSKQLKWILLHELAHVRRHDLAVACFQRLATIVHFINPAVWIANRAINRLREYACDDAALALCDGSQIESGEAFLRVVRYAAESRSPGKVQLDGAIGVFDSVARASCFQRMTRLLDTDRHLRVRLRLGSLCVLLVTAALALPQIRAASEQSSAEQGATEQPGETSEGAGQDAIAVAGESVGTDAAAHRFELTVVGPDGEGVQNARVDVLLGPKPEKWTVHRGTLVQTTDYGALMRAGPDGRLSFGLPAGQVDSLGLDVTTDGYAPLLASWSRKQRSERIPAQYTARLDAGRSVGGIIVDDEGNPIEGAFVHPSIQYKMREGRPDSLPFYTHLKTDAEGKWVYRSLPASMAELTVVIEHPQYVARQASLVVDDFALRDGEGPTAKTVLERGITVRGKVTDEAGAAIAGAVVRARFVNHRREATTGDDGAYRLVGCEPARTSLVVTARGRAPELKNVKIEEDMPPVDFRLKPGSTIRVRVIDSGGNPVPRTRIFFQSWRGNRCAYELGMIHEYTDENGVWQWNEAPPDAVRCDVCPPGSMTIEDQSLVARGEEYVFTLRPPLVISGRVVDAETKEPIKVFRVVPGIRSSEQQMTWARSSSFDARDGHYRITRTDPYFAFLVRIEADGYLPAVSRDVKSSEGSVTIDFELERGKDMEVLVLLPDGGPARGAKVALGLPRAMINVRNGDLIEEHTQCDCRVTDEQGRAAFPPQETPFQLVVTHPSGYAHVKAEPRDLAPTIHLEAWARVEGTFRIGTEAVADTPITLEVGKVMYGRDLPRVYLSHEVVTDENGRFAFNRVVPGTGRIGRRLLIHAWQGAQEVASSRMQPIDLPSGETVRVELGGTGRPVVGKLEPPEGLDEEVDWAFSMVTSVAELPEPPPLPIPKDIEDDAEKHESWLAEWAESDEGKAWQQRHDEYDARRAARFHFTATVGRHGQFRVDDVPAGQYRLNGRLEGVPAERFRGSRPLVGTLGHEFTVPEMEGGRSDEPLDLGTLKVRPIWRP